MSLSRAQQQVRKAFLEHLAKKQDTPVLVPALLGTYSGGSAVVQVPGRPDYVYARLRGVQSELVEAFNNSVLRSFNLPVRVTREGGHWKVYDINVSGMSTGGSGQAFLPNHGAQHSFSGGTGSAQGDITWVYKHQFMPLMTRPSSPGSMGVYVESDYFALNGNFVWFAGTGTPQFTALVPAAPNQALFVTIYLDHNGNLNYITGTPFAYTGAISDPDGLVPMPSVGDGIPLSSIFIYNGQTKVGWSDIWDVRTIVQDPTAGVAAAGWALVGNLGTVAGTNFVGTRDATDLVVKTNNVECARFYNGGGFSVAALIASTAIYADANKKLTSLANGAGVLTNNGAGVLSWAATAPATAHALLSSAHSDTLAATPPTRGSFVVANVTPLWSEFALAGAAGSFITRGADDPAWSGFYFSGTAGGTTSFAVTNSKTLTLTATDSYNITFVNSMTFPADAHGYLHSDGAGTLTWDAGGGGAPGGNDHNVQYNDVGAFGGSDDFLYDGSGIGFGAAIVAYRKFTLNNLVNGVTLNPLIGFDVVVRRTGPAATNTSNAIYGISLDASNIATGDHTGEIVGGQFSAAQVADSGNCSKITGGRFRAMCSDTSTVSVGIGGEFSIESNAFGLIDDAYGCKILAPVHEVNNYYGLYIENATGNTIAYSIYSAGGQSYFAGNVGIAVAVPADPLEVRGNFRQSFDAGNYWQVIVGAAIGVVPWTMCANAAGYLTNNGAGALSWSATTTATAHNLLSATHGDTTASGVTRGDLVVGVNGPSWDDLAVGGANAVLRTDGTDVLWSTFLLSGTAGGTTNFAVTNAKTLTLTATDDFNLTIPKTGTAVVGTGTATRVAAWSDANTIAAGTIVQPAANVLTVTNAAAATLALAITAGKTLTLTATNDFNLTIPATGIAALLATANAFTDSNTIASGKFLTALTDGNTGGLRAGAGSDVLWYRGAANEWQTPDSVTTDATLKAATVNATTVFQRSGTAGYIFVPVTPFFMTDTAANLWSSFVAATGTYSFDTSAAPNSLPAGIKAVALRVSSKWAAASNASTLAMNLKGGASGLLIVRALVAAVNADVSGLCSCDANGDIDAIISGVASTGSSILCFGYFI